MARKKKRATRKKAASRKRKTTRKKSTGSKLCYLVPKSKRAKVEKAIKAALK